MFHKVEMEKPVLILEYCTGCRWLPRACWTAQELLTTFQADLGGVTLVPADTAGRFRLSLGDMALHDRKADGGFIELKELKQRVRDHLGLKKELGHSDAPKPPEDDVVE